MDKTARDVQKEPARRQIILVNPFKCRMWKLHDRLESSLTVESCKGEIESFLKDGQLIPALARRLRADPEHEFELIYGARRLFVAQHLNKDLMIEVCDLSDQDAIVAMDIENRHRADISPYERGMSYARWLRSGLFQSQDDIARALKVSASQVSRLLQLSRLPSAVIAAFPSSADLCEGWGLELKNLLDDPATREATLQRARAIAKLPKRPEAREVFRQLLAAASGSDKFRTKTRDEVVKSRSGAPLFRIRYQQRSVALVLRMDDLSTEKLHTVREAVANALQEASDRKVA